MDDYRQYCALHEEWGQIIARGLRDEDQDRLFELFTQNEQIKNRHGGMPPQNPNAL